VFSKKLIPLLLVLLASQVLVAQTGGDVSRKSLVWYSSRCLEKHSGFEMMTDTKVVVESAKSCQLILNDQPIVFSISSVEGRWEDEKFPGSLKYNLLYDDKKRGEMVIVRTATSTTISINFTKADASGIYYEFYVDRVE
jgi:hypothetical protein